MTDEQLYYKLEPDGCWHKSKFGGPCKCIVCGRNYEEEIYSSGQYRVENLNPDFSTPDGFFFLKKRMEKRGDWFDFLAFLYDFTDDYWFPPFLASIPVKHVDPVAFVTKAKEFFGGNEG